jgi:uncharacterized membrane protein YoaK (UPF0700 family)
VGIAGALDAFAFIRYGAFVANQSGNAVFLGIGPLGEHPAWPASAASLVAFAAGAGTVHWLPGRAHRWTPATVKLVAAEIAMLLWAILNLALGFGRHGATSCVVLTSAGALAMGALATLLTRTAGVATTITCQSGTVAKTGEHAVRWLAGDGPRARLGTFLGLLTISSYAAGGALGALAQRQPRWVPAAGTLALVTLFFVIRRDRAAAHDSRAQHRRLLLRRRRHH